MGRYTVQFKCHSCAHCCTDVICLPTPWDVIRIVRETGQDPEHFLEFITPADIEGVTKNDPAWLRIGDAKYMMALKRGPKGCHFLNKQTKKCSIYAARPILCRLYPFRLEETRGGVFKGFSLHDDVGCPKNRDGEVQTEPLYELYRDDREHHEDYNALVAAFNRKQYPGKKPEDFIGMFITIRRKKPGRLAASA
jgi:Fe-S-cluster containining protein